MDLPCFLCVPNSNQNVCEQAIIVWSFQRSDKVERLGEGQDSFLIVPVVVLIQRQLVLCLTSLLPTSCSHYRLLRPRTGARKMSTAAFFCSTSSRSTHMRASTHRHIFHSQNASAHSNVRTTLNSPNARCAKWSTSFRRRPASTTFPDSARVCAWWSAALYAIFMAMGASQAR